MTEEQFAALAKWVRAEAKLAVAERTYQDERAIADVSRKAAQAKTDARKALIR